MRQGDHFGRKVDSNHLVPFACESDRFNSSVAADIEQPAPRWRQLSDCAQGKLLRSLAHRVLAYRVVVRRCNAVVSGTYPFVVGIPLRCVSRDRLPPPSIFGSVHKEPCDDVGSPSSRRSSIIASSFDLIFGGLPGLRPCPVQVRRQPRRDRRSHLSASTRFQTRIGPLGPSNAAIPRSRTRTFGRSPAVIANTDVALRTRGHKAATPAVSKGFGNAPSVSRFQTDFRAM